MNSGVRRNKNWAQQCCVPTREERIRPPGRMRDEFRRGAYTTMDKASSPAIIGPPN